MVASTYDANKNIVTQDRGTPGSSADGYSFDRTVDAKDRLTNWLRDNGDAQNWDLSFEGDWDQTDGSFDSVPFDQSRTHNDPHEITTIDPDNDPMTSNSITMLHDAKGNLSQDHTGLAHTYDFDNQLSQVVVSGSATRGVEGTHTYAYDALGRRIAKTVDTNADNTPDQTIVFVYAGQQILAEYDETTGLTASSPVRKYIYCATCYIDEPIAMVDGASGGDVFYYHRDRSYNVIGLSDDAGAIVELYSYTLYGERTVFNASWTALAATAFGNQRGFQGLRHDIESGLIENRARVLDPKTGRFLQRDPLGYPYGLNTYAAYHVMRGMTDSSGMQPDSSLGPEIYMHDGGWGIGYFTGNKPTELEMRYTVKVPYWCDQEDGNKPVIGTHSIPEYNMLGELDRGGFSVLVAGVVIEDKVIIESHETKGGLACPNGEKGSGLRLELVVAWQHETGVGITPGIGPFSWDIGLDATSKKIWARKYYTVEVFCCCQGNGVWYLKGDGRVTKSRVEISFGGFNYKKPYDHGPNMPDWASERPDWATP